VTPAAPIIALEAVRFRWPGRSSFALAIPEFAMAPGERLLLLGESGSGKSTLLSLIAGTVEADFGRVTVAGQCLSDLPGGRRDRFRADHIGMIFQQFNLLPFGSVLDNILLPLRFAPLRRDRVGDGRAEAARLCTALGLPEVILGEKAGKLSVGQQQRVAVARSLIGQPPIVVADEPTSALDETNQQAFLDLLFGQVSASDSALLMVSHDPRLAPRFDRVLRMDEIASVERSAA
jgi:putative ABC transport system ATP-binding protein